MATDIGLEVPTRVTIAEDETGVFCLGLLRPISVANAPRVAKYVSSEKDYLKVSERKTGQLRSIRVAPSDKGSIISETGKGVFLQIKSIGGEGMATIEVIKAMEGEKGISSLWIYNQEKRGWEETLYPPKYWSSVYLLPITGGVVILDKDQASNREIMGSLETAVNNLVANETEAQFRSLAPDFRGYRLPPGI